MASIKRPAGGFSLLEVLISIIVLSVGLLGAVGMLMTSVRSTNESGSFTTAVNLVRELSEKVRINKNVAARRDEKNTYVLSDWKSSTDTLPGSGTASACIGSDADCTGTTLAAWDLQTWAQRVKTSLPEARVAVCFDDTFWDEAKGAYAWACSNKGRNLVVKLGWTARLRSDDEKNADERPPRVVMQLIPGQDYDAYTPVGF